MSEQSSIDQGEWVIANIYSGEIAPETARYATQDEAGQVLSELVQQGRLEEGDYEVRPAPAGGQPAPALRPGTGIEPPGAEPHGSEPRGS